MKFWNSFLHIAKIIKIIILIFWHLYPQNIINILIRSFYDKYLLKINKNKISLSQKIISIRKLSFISFIFICCCFSNILKFKNYSKILYGNSHAWKDPKIEFIMKNDNKRVINEMKVNYYCLNFHFFLLLLFWNIYLISENFVKIINYKKHHFVIQRYIKKRFACCILDEWLITLCQRNCAASVLYIIQSSLKWRIAEFFIINLISWNSVGNICRFYICSIETRFIVIFK